MSERIICDDNGGELREEIVRCKDCKHYHGSINGCDEFGDESRGEFAYVGPGGFCAWGERKVVDSTTNVVG